MKTKQLSVEQIVAVLYQAEPSAPVADLTRKGGMSVQTFYGSKKVDGGLEPSQSRNAKQLEEVKC